MNFARGITPERYNRLPNLEVACLEREKHAEALQKIGDFLCQEGLEKQLGVTIGHRHYEMHRNEYILRVLSDDTYLTFVSSLRRDDLVPISWTASDPTGRPEVNEWICAEELADDQLSDQDVQSVFVFVGSLNCGGVFGLSRLAASPLVDGVSYEKTCDTSRIQFVSTAMEDEVSSDFYAQSLFRFVSTPAGAAIYAQQKCQLCRGCFNSEKPTFKKQVSKSLNLQRSKAINSSDEITSMRLLHANLIEMEQPC